MLIAPTICCVGMVSPMSAARTPMSDGRTSPSNPADITAYAGVSASMNTHSMSTLASTA